MNEWMKIALFLIMFKRRFKSQQKLDEIGLVYEEIKNVIDSKGKNCEQTSNWT